MEFLERLSLIGLKASTVCDILGVIWVLENFQIQSISNFLQKFGILTSNSMSLAEKATVSLSKWAIKISKPLLSSSWKIFLSVLDLFSVIFKRNKITHRVIYDILNLGIVVHPHLCGHVTVTTKLNSDENIRWEVYNLNKDLTFDEGTKLVLLVSYTTDEMIKMTTMVYPDVCSMYCMGCANHQQRNLLISVVWTPIGKCHMSILPIIPSHELNLLVHFFVHFFPSILCFLCLYHFVDNARVFSYIFCYIFPQFYGKETIQRIR